MSKTKSSRSYPEILMFPADRLAVKEEGRSPGAKERGLSSGTQPLFVKWSEFPFCH
jgi:hypothetical protein